MKRRRRVVALSLAVAATGAVALGLTRLGPPPKRMKEVSVDASRLPASVSVFGSRVVLASARKTPKGTEFAVRIQSGRSRQPVVLETDPTITAYGRETDWVGETGYSDTEGTVIATLQPGVSDVGFVQRVYRKTSRGKCGFTFPNLGIGRSRASQQRQGVEVKIARTVVGALDRSWRTTDVCHSFRPPPGRYVVVQAEIRHPGDPEFATEVDVAASTYTLGGRQEWAMGFLDWENACVLQPNKRPIKAWATRELVVYDQMGETLDREAHKRTVTERALSHISSRAASWAASRRVSAAVREAGRLSEVSFAFPLSQVNPKRFTFRVTIPVPPVPEDRAVVTFRNVPVPPP